MALEIFVVVSAEANVEHAAQRTAIRATFATSLHKSRTEELIVMLPWICAAPSWSDGSATARPACAFDTTTTRRSLIFTLFQTGVSPLGTARAIIRALLLTFLLSRREYTIVTGRSWSDLNDTDRLPARVDPRFCAVAAAQLRQAIGPVVSNNRTTA
jgi:hypothetical protein